MFLQTTPEGKIYKELAEDHFADPEGLGRYALFLRTSQGDLIPAQQMEPALLLSGRYRPITLEGRNLFASKDFFFFFKHLVLYFRNKLSELACAECDSLFDCLCAYCYFHVFTPFGRLQDTLTLPFL